MSGNVNRIKNADFRKGRSQPAGWAWESSDKKITWEQVESAAKSAPAGVSIKSDHKESMGLWSQTVVVSPKQYYRVEAKVRCDLTAADEQSGLVLQIEPFEIPKKTARARKPTPIAHPVRTTPPLHRATESILVRTFFGAENQVRRLKLDVGVIRATGWAIIEEVRVIEIIEPDEESHIMATPPPVYSVPAPRIAKTVCICSETADQRELTRILGTCLGSRFVQTLQPKAANPDQVKADAIFLPDAKPPHFLRNLKNLLAFSEKRLVVISLPAFAKLAGDSVNLRRIDQADDPTFAKVLYANHITRGFALHDVFSFGEKGKGVFSFAQNQFKKSKQLSAFLDRHGFVTVLGSMCNKDATTGHPICLYRETPAGGLVVLDINAVEQPASTFAEPNLAMQLILNILGYQTTGLGQYVVPIPRGEKMRDFVREMNARLEEWVVHDEDVPIKDVTQQLVTLGREDQVFGLPIKPKPMILIRSGLQSGDVESVYSAFIWLKQLLGRNPHECPYAQALSASFRFGWLPFSAPWESRDGWARAHTPRNVVPSLDIDTEDGLAEALIDLISTSGNQVRVLFPAENRHFASFSRWLPDLISILHVGESFGIHPSEGNTASNRDSFAWRWSKPEVSVEIDPSAFENETYKQLGRTIKNLVRIEVPSHDADFVANSVQRTNLMATLLELVVGLTYGLIAVNRTTSTIQIDGFAPTPPGDALIVHRAELARSRRAAEAG